MVDPVSARLWLRRGLFLAIVLAALFLRLLPLGPARWPGPDLMLALILAWVIRRPDDLPALLIAGAVLIEDFLLMRPPGLWAALVLIATEFLRGRSALTRELTFVAEWFLVGLVIFALLVANRLILGLTLTPQPGFGFAFVQAAFSVLCYPAVVAVLHLALSLHKPSTGEIDDYGRRL